MTTGAELEASLARGEVHLHYVKYPAGRLQKHYRRWVWEERTRWGFCETDRCIREPKGGAE